MVQATAKKPVKKAAVKKTSTTEPEYGVEKSKDLAWCPKKLAIFKALKALKATGKDSSVNTGDLAKKADVTNRDARHYSYHAKAGGLIDVFHPAEGSTSYTFALSKKGQALDLATVEKEMKAKKAAKDKD